MTLRRKVWKFWWILTRQPAFNFCVYKKNEERLRYMYLTPHPKSSQNWCSPGSINGIFMNNINTGQLMEYNEDCTVVVLSKWSVFISFSVSSKSYNSVYRSQFYSTKEVSYDTSMMWHTVLSFKMIKLTSTHSFQHKRDTYSVLVSGWQK